MYLVPCPCDTFVEKTPGLKKLLLVPRDTTVTHIFSWNSARCDTDRLHGQELSQAIDVNVADYWAIGLDTVLDPWYALYREGYLLYRINGKTAEVICGS